MSGSKMRDPMDATKARLFYMEQRRILRKAWVRSYGSTEVLVVAQLEEVESKLETLNKGENR